MPIYRFRCPKCKVVKEEFFHVNHEKKLDCEDCKKPMKPILSPGYFKITHDHYYATIGKTCGTETEAQREMDKLKYKLEKNPI